MKKFSLFLVFAIAGFWHICAQKSQNGSGNRSDHETKKISDLAQIDQYRISEEMGNDDPRFYFYKFGGKITATRCANGLTGEISTEGVIFRTGSFYWSVGLKSILHENHILEFRRPSYLAGACLDKNHLKFQDGTITEWYVNGPFGLQQGWTIERPLGARDTQLILALQTSGNVVMKAEGSRHGMILSDLQGNPLFNYRGLLAYDATHRELPVEFVQQGNELSIHVTVGNAIFPVTIDPWGQSAKLVASSPAEDDYLGCSVSISSDGSIVAVGARHADPDGTSNAGAVYVFVKGGGAWGDMTQTAKLTASDKAANDYLGTSVSISADGNTIVAGAYLADVGGTSNAGAAYIFEKGSGAWSDMTQTAKLTTSDKAVNDCFAYSASISSDGSTVAVGKYNAAPGGTAYAGAVYMYVRGGSNWSNMTQNAILYASDKGQYDQLGISVSISADGNTVASGATGNNGYKGAIYIFLKGAGWSGNMIQSAKLTASGGSQSLGRSVAISSDGSTVVAGQNSDTYKKVLVFEKGGGGWSNMTQTATLSFSYDLLSGSDGSVAISATGDTIVAGQPKADPYGGESYSGAAFVFIKSGISWTNMTEYCKLIPTSRNSDHFGISVSMSYDGNTVSIGSEWANSGSTYYCGAAYVFTPCTVSATTTVSHVHCQGGSDGTATANPIGLCCSFPPYTYSSST